MANKLSPRDPSENYLRRMFPLPEIVVPEKERRFKLVVIGDSDTGKTCLLYTFVKEEFEVEDAPWLFEEAVVDVTTQGKDLEFILWDLSGNDDYDGLRIALYDDTDIFLICFDIGNPGSIENVEKKWIPEIKMEKPDTPFILVGCKNDLRTDSAVEYYQTVQKENHDTLLSCVSRLQAERLALQTGAKAYIECCAKTKYNIDMVFQAAAEFVLNRNDPTFPDQNKGLFGLKGLGKYARRKSVEIGGRLNPGLFFSDRSNAVRRGSIF